MPKYRYKAVSPHGQIVEGWFEALDRAALIEHLHNLGHIPIRASEMEPGTSGEPAPVRKRHRGKLQTKDLALLSQEIATLLSAGLPLDRALMTIGRMSGKGKKRDFVLRVLEGVRGGSTLADAVVASEMTLPNYYAGMIRAGEASGNLPQIFTRISELLNYSREIEERIRSGMYYPTIVVVVAFATIVVLLTVVVPQFRPLFDSSGAILPTSTRIIIVSGDFLRDYWMVILAVLAFGFLCFRIHYAQAHGKFFWHQQVLRVPAVGTLIRKIETARLSRTLGTLLSSGLAEISALSIATTVVANFAVKKRVEGVGGCLKRGEGWSLPLRETGFIPEMAIQLINVGEESGKLPEMLIRAADILDQDTQNTIERLLSLLVPVITIVLGMFVAAIIGAMLVAILSAYSMPI